MSTMMRPAALKGGIPMNPTCPRCGGKHGVEVTGDGYEHDCAACGGHLMCAIGPEGGEMYPYHREDGSCGCNGEPHTCGEEDEDGDLVRVNDDDRQTLRDLRLFMLIARDQTTNAGLAKGVETSNRCLALLDRLIGDAS